MINIKNLFKKYYIGKENITVLNDVNLKIEQGEFVAILGPSGCGKSTLLSIIGGLDCNIEGKFYINEDNTKEYKEKDWNRWRKYSVGFIFQNFNLIPHLTAKENVKLAMEFNGYDRVEAEKRALELIDMVGLLEKSDYLPSQLSGGQKQRIAIARAMANNPKVILADEPTGALDTASANNIMEILHNIHRDRGITIIMVTHNKKLVEGVNKIIHMKDGQIESVINNTSNVYSKSTDNKLGKLSFISAIRIGIRNIIRQKSRSILTVLGTAIGIAGMLLMIGIGSGAENKVNSELGVFLNDNTIWVKGEDEVRVFNNKDYEQLKNIEGVDKIIEKNSFFSIFNYKDISVEGIMNSFMPIESRTDYELNLVTYGSLPKKDDSNEIVLTSDIAKQLLNGDEDTQKLIGENITILYTLDRQSILTYEAFDTFKVIGIIDSGIIPGPSYIAHKTSATMASKSIKTGKVVQEGLDIIASESADYDKTVSDIRNLGYRVSTNKEDFESISIIVLFFKIFLIFIASIAIFISGIMIKIVLQTNVIERTKEIGIMCAIGAGSRDIKRIFVTEAGILGALAGIVGVVLGQVLGSLLNIILINKNGFKFSLYNMTMQSIIVCILISIIVAILSGRKPAKQATKVDPTEALRYE